MTYFCVDYYCFLDVVLDLCGLVELFVSGQWIILRDSSSWRHKSNNDFSPLNIHLMSIASVVVYTNYSVYLVWILPSRGISTTVRYVILLSLFVNIKSGLFATNYFICHYVICYFNCKLCFRFYIVVCIHNMI